MVEVFRTNVQKKAQSRQLLRVLYDAFPSYRINFDLTDCDRVLRVEGEAIVVSSIIVLLTQEGYLCQVLE